VVGRACAYFARRRPSGFLAIRFTRRRFFALSLARKRLDRVRFFERAEVRENKYMVGS
jgi:hypothetical protein